MTQPIIIQQPEPRVMRDPILQEPRYRMKVHVNVHSTSVYQADVLNHMMPRGEHTVVAYASQVPSIMAKVETRPDAIAQATEIVRRKRLEAMTETMRGRGNQHGWQDVDPLEYDSVKHPELRRIFRHDSFKGNDTNVDGEFRNIVGRSILPLTLAEKGEELEPLRPEQETAIASIVEQLGSSFGKQLAQTQGGGVSGLSIEQLTVIVSEAAARAVAAVLAAPAQPPKNGRDGK